MHAQSEHLRNAGRSAPATPEAAARRERLWLAAILAAAVIAVGGISAHRYITLDRELTETSLARRAALAEFAAAVVSEKLDRVIDIGVSLASRVQFREHVAAGRWEQASEILRGVPKDFPFFTRVSLFDVRGTFQASVPDRLPLDGQNFSHRDWYIGVSKAWRPYISAAYTRATSPVQTVFATALPIPSAGGEPAAILHLQSDVAPFFSWLADMDLGAGGYAYVVDSKGQLIWHPRIRAQEKLLDYSSVPAVRALLQGRSGVETGTEVEIDAEAVRGYAPARNGWGVVVAQPSAQAFAARDLLLKAVLVDGALIGAFAIAMIVFGTLSVLHKRRAEADRAQRLQLEEAQGNLGRQAERLRIVHEIDRAIIANEAPQAIAGAVIGPLRELLDVPRAIVNLFHLESNQVEWLAAAGRKRMHVGPGVRYGMRLMGDVDALKRGETQLVDTRALPPGPEVEALLASGVNVYLVVPMIAAGALIGAISFGGKEAAFPPEQVAIAREVATQLAIAITQARLFERVRGHAGELEREVEARTAELKAANQELESFSYSVSHDLRAPLRAVDGYSLMLEEDYAARLDDEGRRLLGVVRAEAARMGQLIDDLLHFSQVGRRQLIRTPIDMHALASEVIAESSALYPKARVHLDRLPAASGDRSLLRHVWVNLVGNALKYSSQSEAPRVTVSAQQEAANFVYTVRDNGAGFEMRYYEKLFKVFQRLHRQDEFEGTGVGLAIVQRVVSRHGGRVWAESEPGKGACFHFSLPKEA